MNERLKELRSKLDEQMENNSRLQHTAEDEKLSEDSRAEARKLWVDGLDAVDVLQASIANESRAIEQVKKYREHAGEEERETAGQEDRGGSFGERVVRSIQERLSAVTRGVDRFAFSAEEVRAATTTTGVTNPQTAGVITIPLERPTIANLLPGGTLTGDSVKVFKEGPVTGGPDAVAEDGLKPELSGGFTEDVLPLAKIAGHTKETDEFIEDFPALKSVVEGRLITRLVLKEEQHLVNGTGTGAQMTGILATSGIQTQAQGTDSIADAVFKAMTKIQTATYLNADVIIINPADYETLRLAKDANTQYYGGGYFSGAYGNGGIATMPGLWGISTVVTSAVAKGTIIVGASQSAMLWRKGGIRVDVANQNEDDFVHDRITVRAEVREVLAIYYPAAWVKVTLATP